MIGGEKMKIQKITEKINLNVAAQWPWTNAEGTDCKTDCTVWKEANARLAWGAGEEASGCYQGPSAHWTTIW